MIKATPDIYSVPIIIIKNQVESNYLVLGLYVCMCNVVEFFFSSFFFIFFEGY